MKPTIYDVANKLGVSIATVSKVINNTGRISDKTRKLVLETIKEMNYQPSTIASALKGKSTYTIGILLPDLANPFFATLARSIEDYGYNQGFSVIICSTDYDPKKEIAYIELLKQKSVDGIIIVSGVENSQVLQNLIDEGIPIAVVAREIPSLEVNTVSIDNFMGGYLAAKYLASLGHTKNAIIGSDYWSTRERLRGYKQALEEEGIKLYRDIEMSIGIALETGEELAGKLLDSSDPPTAIFACSDILAIGAIRAARKRGLSVPSDLSVIGFDDSVWAKVSYPQLTTLTQPAHKMGFEVMELLNGEISEKKKDKQRIILLPKLVIRESTEPYNK